MRQNAQNPQNNNDGQVQNCTICNSTVFNKDGYKCWKCAHKVTLDDKFEKTKKSEKK